MIFFATCDETQKWGKWLASQLESPTASCALKELKEMEDTLSRNELRETLEKGIAHYNQNLSWEERNLIETYQKEGEIKVICATSIMAMGINLHFKNVIIALDKIYNDEGNYPLNYRTSLTFAAVENMGERAGILEFEEMRKEGNSFNFQNRQEFGRVIFLAHSLLFQTVYQNLYFKFLKGNNCNHEANKQSINIDDDLITYLLRLAVNINLNYDELKSHVKKEEFVSLKSQSKFEDNNFLSGYWQFAFSKANIHKRIENALNILQINELIRINENGVLSPTDSGILIAAKRIKVETFLFFKSWLSYCKNGDISILEILFLLALSPDGKALPIPFSQAIRDDYKKGIFQNGYRKNYWNKLLHLIFEQDDEEKKLFRDNILMKKEKEEITSLEDYITCKKTHLLYDWVEGKKSVKTIEQEYGLYRGCIYRLGEGFSWLADSLSAIAESVGWEKKHSGDLDKIKMLSNRLVEGVQEDGINLALLYIPGLSRYHIGRLVRAGYGDGKCLKEVSEEELIKILPKRLVGRIKNRFSAKNYKVRDGALQGGSPTEGRHKVCPYTQDDSRNLKVNTLLALPETENCKPTFATILEIDRRHTDRIIFEGKVVKLTPLAFSLLYLLAQNPKEVLLYDYLINTIWKGSEDATYTQVTFHLSKIRRAVLKTICHNKKNRKKVKDIFKVISRRGVMLNLAEDKLKIS
ncbi:MAG: winged helix-turn-helix domain-containing protein [Candidatus Atribacteria bacterium]|nr:winged helix-turn-helix domain-containing protein [Candidatus Atribacteria bacterium]